MKGRVWLVLGALLGIAIGLGDVRYFAGAAKELSDTAQRLVGSAGHQLIVKVADHGAPQRVVLGVTAALAVLVPGLSALLLVVAARSSLRLRALVALLLVVVGAASFAYQPKGVASGVLVLALALAAVALAAVGPLVASPLSALAALIGCEFLPRVLSRHSSLPNVPVQELHLAITNSAGAPLWLRVVVLVAAALPFAWAAKLVLR